MVDVNEMTIVNWEKGRTKPIKGNLERIRAIMECELPTRLLSI
jgi:DNA-binding XRE family transcriptional regulator